METSSSSSDIIATPFTKKRQFSEFFQQSVKKQKTEEKNEYLGGDILLIHDFVTEEEERNLLKSIREQPWLTDLKRRVQHYGYKYDYKGRNLEPLGKLPEFSREIVEKLVAKKLFKEAPDQLIVNEYTPGQGIAAHTDNTRIFGDTISALSLGSTVVMNFKKGEETLDILLPRRSLLLMKGEARSKWTHQIKAVKKDKITGGLLERDTRLSMTFRNTKKIYFFFCF